MYENMGTLPDCRFADLVPDVPFDLSAMPRGVAKTNAIEAIYEDGFIGSFLPTKMEDGVKEDFNNPLGAAARYYRDEFRSDLGKNSYRASDNLAKFEDKFNFEYGYCASVDAFRTFDAQAAEDAVDWLFRFLQNSGNCVGASGVEMFHGMIGTRAAFTEFNEAYKYLMAMWAYAFRGYCGAGWYGSRHASVTKQYGYCYALPLILDKYKYGTEQQSEDYTVNTWCRGGPPNDIINFVKENGWFFEDGAIFEMDDDIDALKEVSRRGGQFHHGSNVTSGSSKPDVLKRIGGHQQTTFAVSWDPRIIAFFSEKGFNLDANDAWTANHQTWGPGFSGECDDKYWPYGYDESGKVYSLLDIKGLSLEQVQNLEILWGLKPEGAWVCGGKHLLANVGGYGYLPYFKGLPGDNPPPPPPDDELTLVGAVSVTPPVITPTADGLTTVTLGDVTYKYKLQSVGDGKYEYVKVE